MAAVSGLYTPFVFVYEKAISEVGVPTRDASLILSLLGIFNTVGRLMAGWLADRPWADSLVIYNVAAILAGLVTCLVAVTFSFELLCLYAAFFGILIGSHRTSICILNKKHLKNVGPVRHDEPPRANSPGVATVLSHAACASMSTTTTTTMRDRGDRYGAMEWAQ